MGILGGGGGAVIGIRHQHHLLRFLSYENKCLYVSQQMMLVPYADSVFQLVGFIRCNPLRIIRLVRWVLLGFLSLCL